MSAPEERSEAPEPKRQRGASDADASVTPPADSGVEVETAPAVSVIMPCRNAMPWLPDCVASVLAQEGLEADGGLELIVADDASTDGSTEWLAACEAALRAADARRDLPPGRRRVPPADASSAPAAADEDGDSAFPPDRFAWEPETFEPPSVDAVVSRRAPGNALLVLSVQTRGPSGQGLALNAAYRRARAPLVGEMESDDLRPPRAFAMLRDALTENPDWDGATSAVKLVGWDRPGMARWIEWQNAANTPRRMARERFVEIPALRASGLFRRRAMEALATAASSSGRSAPYRDLWPDENGRVRDYARSESGPESEPEEAGWWPVDADFWHRWFAEGLVAGKTSGAPLYYWRQYPSQSTRTHARCSLERLRECKAHFLVARGGPAAGVGDARGDSARAAAEGVAGPAVAQVWGTGETLRAWVDALRGAVAAAAVRRGWAEDAEAARAAAARRVRGVEYKPGAPVGWKRLREEDAASRAEGGLSDENERVLRLFAFGMEKARGKVRATFTGFDEEGDEHWFVA